MSEKFSGGRKKNEKMKWKVQSMGVFINTMNKSVKPHFNSVLDIQTNKSAICLF